ncbi:hypothetical protein [Pseudoalteromonas sp. DY56-GL79]|uniref:hypothetical protein n=1 Tax=Pseudoalteromonas sp. DY56-GL79 TaxID=2967131 RepID=UPI00352BBAE1
MMINFELIANQIDLSAKQNIALKAGRSHRSVIQSLNTILPLRRKCKFHKQLTPLHHTRKALADMQCADRMSAKSCLASWTCLTRRLHYIGLGFED